MTRSLLFLIDSLKIISILFLNSSLSFGFIYSENGPPASLKQPPLEVITGIPEFNASIIGIPKPSKIEG